MGEIVSGWSDDDHVFLVEREGEVVSARRIPAKWSAFFRGMDEKDRAALQRDRDVIALSHDEHGYTRADFRNRHARRETLEKVGKAIAARRMDVFTEEDASKLYQGAILEGDVGPLRRLLSDFPGIAIGTPRACYLDLEVDSRKRWDDMKDGKARILAWALYALEDDGATPRKVASAVLPEDADGAERDFLRELFEVLAGFDLVLSWNGDEFDFKVLEMRMQKLRVKLANGRLPIWNRWCWLDHMEAFKKYNQAHDSGEERASFALDAIASHIVGEGKTDFDASKTWEEWEAGGERRARLLSYCEHDTALMARIEAKTGFVALHIAVCQVTRCFPDSASLGAAQQGDGFLLALGAQRGYRFPTKKSFDEMGEVDAFAGAFVMSPKRIGVLDWVHVCDFAGLYPSIMRSFNMSLDTYLAPAFARALSGQVPMARLPIAREVHFRTDRRGIFPEALDLIVAERARYTKRSDDAEPGSEEWSRYKRLSSAYKIIANSFYGIVGSPFTRFFDREVAEGVTQTGAWLIKHVSATVEATNRLTAVYGDTDSIFAMAKEDGGDPASVTADVELFEKIVSTLNEQWPETLRRMGCTESRIKLEFEKSFRRLVLVSAKRYAARYSRWKGKPAPADMKPEVKGLEYKRGDALRLAREMQREAIDILLDVDRPTPTPADFRVFVDRWRTRILEGELSVDDIVLSQSVRNLGDYATRYTSAKCTNRIQPPGTTTKKAMKSCGYDFGDTVYDEEVSGKCPRCSADRKLASQPAHVRVAKVLRDRGVQITEGTRIEYLIVGRPDDEEDDGKLNPVPARDPGAFERIDRNYYWDSRILPPTARLLEAVWPHEKWKETAASRRKAADAVAKAIEQEARRLDPNRALEGLPLFAHDPGPAARPAPRPSEPAPESTPEASTSPPPAAAPATPPPARKPRKPRAPRPPPPPEPPWIVVAYRPDLPPDQSRAKLERVVTAIRAATAAFPGRSPVRIRVEDRRTTPPTLVEELDGGAVARGDRARYALERVVGVGNVRDLEQEKIDGAGTAGASSEGHAGGGVEQGVGAHPGSDAPGGAAAGELEPGSLAGA